MSDGIKELYEQTLTGINLNLENQKDLLKRSEQMSVFCAALNGIISSGNLTNAYQVVRKARLITSITCGNDLKNKPDLEY